MFSHSGRTDSDGGHYNRSTGEYHSHNGSNGIGKIVGGGIALLFFLALGKSKKK